MWIRSGIKPGGGQAQIWKALAGQTISCTSGEYAPYTVWYGAMVDTNGQPYSRISISGVTDTGWIAGAYVENRSANGLTYPNMTLSIGGLVAQIFNFGNTTAKSQHITCIAGWS